jgi:hypothetical protein
VDRWPARTVMIICDVTSAVLYASVPVAAWLGWLTIWQVAAVVLLAGGANVFFTTAYQVYLPSLIAADDLAEGNAKLQGSASVALIAGRSAAGITTEALGAASAVLFNAVSFLVSAACLLRIGAATGHPRNAHRSTTVRAEIAAGARLIVRDSYLRPLTVYATVGNFAYSGYSALIVLFLVRTAGLGPATVGVLLAGAGVGGTCGALIARWLSTRFGTARSLLLVGVTGIFGLLVPLTHAGYGVVYYLAGSVVMTAGMLIGNIIVAAFRQAYCPPAMLGRAVAGMRFLAFGAIPAGALIAGSLGTALGVRNALWVSLGAFVLSGSFLFAPAIASVRDLPRRRPDDLDRRESPGRTASA